MESIEIEDADVNFDEGEPLEGEALEFINNEPELGSYQHDATDSSYVVQHSDGTKSWIPIVPDSLKPVIHARFETLDQAIMMYSNKSGVPENKSFNSLDQSVGKREFRNSNVKRCDCKAAVRFRLLKGIGKYECYSFIENHNHPLLDSNDMCFSRKRRQLGFGDQMLIHRGNSFNMGATRVHQMRTSFKGGYEFSSSSAVDFQNFKRDMDKYIVAGGDAQMFVDMMNSRKEVAPNFFFDYKVSDSKLVCTFWADEVSRFNYSEFGDVMSFDATFRTNRYAMVFVPFTVVNNHKKTVVVGAALVNKENVVNFEWVLEAFLKAHKNQPTLVLTDQCPAMKQAIASVFPYSRHRLCMWHIMNKLPQKFSSQLLNETNFRKDLNKIVWDVLMEPDEFELKWNILIENYSLTGDKWLQSLYRIRESWIPAYFRDIPMCCLMKTTSRSESINSFFNDFSHYGNTLVSFMKSFDNALDKQRFSQRNLDHVTRSTFPKLLTPSKIERYACDVYTRRVFNDVQKEIYKAAWACSIESVVDENDIHTYIIAQRNKALMVKSHYKVLQNKSESTIVCSCNHFVRCGLLCRHIFKVLINTNIEEIPEKYIMRRWRRNLMPIELQHFRVWYGDVDEEQERLFNEILSMVEHCFGKLRNENAKLSCFAERVRSLKKEIDDEFPVEYGASTKIEAIVDLIGVSQPENVKVYPPTGIRNKGCGRGKRLVGAVEKAIIKSSRNKRMCKRCGKLGNHDSRNCPMRGIE